jgi:FMN reductase
MAPRTAVVVGNPRPRSRTLTAAITVARRLTDFDPDLVVDLATIGPALLSERDPGVTALVEEVGAAELVVVASPTYKASYTGLLKIFLDRFPSGTGLRGTAVAVMLGAAPQHALAGEVHLRPLLAELGAAVPAPALFVLDHEYDRPEAYDSWLSRARPLVGSLVTTTGVPA